MAGIKLYVGSDKKLHFVNSAGADSAIPFKSDVKHSVNMYITGNTNQQINVIQIYVDGSEVLHSAFDFNQSTQNIYNASI